MSGEASAAYAMLAPAVALPPPWRYFAIGAALVYGTTIGLVRMAVGGHFLTDVIFAGILTALIAWFLHGLLYRWRRTRLSEHAIEKSILAIRSKYANLPGTVSNDGRDRSDAVPSPVESDFRACGAFALALLTAIRDRRSSCLVVDLVHRQSRNTGHGRENRVGYSPSRRCWHGSLPGRSRYAAAAKLACARHRRSCSSAPR